MDNKILVIGIAGGTGSGKTTLVNKLAEHFGSQVTVLSHDNYYKCRDGMPFEQREKLNYDEPEALETDLMARHLQALRQGQSIQCPQYDFAMHNRKAETKAVIPQKVILVEGILIFENEALRQQMDIKIFVDTPADVRLCRRIRRDVRDRGRTLESVLEQYQATVRPMHEKYVEPSKQYADLVALWGGKNPVVLDIIMGHIQRYLEEG